MKLGIQYRRVFLEHGIKQVRDKFAAHNTIELRTNSTIAGVLIEKGLELRNLIRPRKGSISKSTRIWETRGAYYQGVLQRTVRRAHAYEIHVSSSFHDLN